MLTARFIFLGVLISFFDPEVILGQQMRLSFEEMWTLALDRNFQIRNAELLVDKSTSMQKSAWDFGTLDFNFTRGQQNTDLVDNMYDIRQGLGAPFTISATRKYYNSEQDLYRQNAIKVTKEIKKELCSLYYEWLYEYQLVSILDSSIVIYKKSADFADLQYKTGESNLLSKVILSSEVQRLIIRRDLHMVNLSTIQNEIQTILNTDSVYIPAEDELNKLMVILPDEPELYDVDSVPYVKTQRSLVDVMDRYYKIEKSKISPSLSAGYYNQEIDHIAGFQGWQIGFSFPLFFFPQKARSQAAYIELSRTENQYLYEKLKARREIENLLAKYDQMDKSIRYYEDQRLINAELINQNANLLYESGSIGYIEFVQNLTTSRQIWEDYIKLINEYNQYVIELNYYFDH
jgi:cobalt-zinc-cadmium resistance protein CzcA